MTKFHAGATFEQVDVSQGRGCRTGRISLISPCCQARTDVDVSTLRWYRAHPDLALRVHCGRPFNRNYRSRHSKGCDWHWKLVVTFSDDHDWPVNVTWIV